MAPAKKPTHRVIHKKFNFARGEKDAKGKANITRLPVGTLLTLTKEQADGTKEKPGLVKRGFVEPLGDVKTVDATGTDD